MPEAAFSTLDALMSAALGPDLTRLQAQQLMLHALGRPLTERAWLLAHGDEPPSLMAQQRWQQGLQRWKAGEPLGYITGEQAFHGLRLLVDRRVLVPRPDTETLVDWALELLDSFAPQNLRSPLEGAHPSIAQAQPRVLDLGTGSGAIALAIKQQRPDTLVDAVDFSADALCVAAANAAALQLPIAFSQGHWWQGAPGTYDLVVSNPPYIAAGDPHLPALQAEPASALVAADNGWADLQAIIDGAQDHLRDGAWLLLEHGHEQGAGVCDRLKAAGLEDVQARHDLAGIHRCSGGRKAPMK